jgi:TPR repeat protein
MGNHDIPIFDTSRHPRSSLCLSPGLSKAQLDHGLKFYFGYENAQNISLSADYFKLSVDQDKASGQLNYGLMLSRGDGIALDRVFAFRFFKLSGCHDHASSQLIYALMLFSRDEIAKCKSRTVDYFKLFADRGDAN